METFKRFYIKPEIITGAHAMTYLQAYAGKRVAIVTDAFMLKSGVVDKVKQYLVHANIDVFAEVLPDPSVDIIKKGASQFAQLKPEVIIAIGGGSPMDATKGIMAILKEMYIDHDMVMVAIPTTSGSGSEVTAYAVISDPVTGSKLPLVSPNLLPDIALLDPNLVATVPKSVTADTGMDVITHALEAYVSTGATDFTDAFAEKALVLAYTNLPTAFFNGSDLLAREKMHNASCMAGLAFSTSGLGLVHGMAHAIGGVLHIAHGKINAMLLPLVIEYNAALLSYNGMTNTTTAMRYATCAQLLGIDASSTQLRVVALVKELRRMNKQFGIPATLKELGSDLQLLAQKRSAIIEAALADGCTATNPRVPTYQDIDQIITLISS